ncbi:MAG: PhaM family polyhydroxyalkanoate granule multifunctional regulatory protein [Castellaniella sp.]|uniref:PhaM family polyhydroxyalkanoate granule multifunctional regulatory protein n=1 Tax=Castellaniella sp. TaxID=1955812 RepID=UPI003A8B947A
MAQDSSNPFVLPGFGQQGDGARNPLFAGLDMMRQAWQNMADAGGLDAAQMTPMSLEDLDRRIRELQTVQNWLQLNASMLANTIQGMEIQRSTLNTLKSFAGSVMPDAAAAASSAQADAAGADYARAAGDWWNLVQQQFEQLASATAAGLQGMAETAEQATAPAAKRAAPRKKSTTAARKKPAAPARKSPAKKTARRTR